VILLCLFSGCVKKIETKIEYRDVPAKSIVMDGKAYPKSDYKVVQKKVYESELKTMIELRGMLDECLERERIK
jgi:hypothetical protein